ncbi:hypothetical protein GGR55DRAFT_698638 [Xylaria sp. FL0064]|nr:hypothetical protein GGR55DRAFT_698638 [Xylaria sp. FL0064]
MAYHTPIFQAAHSDPTIRKGIPEPTYGTLEPSKYTATPYASIPLSSTPRSRPFRVFAGTPPTPPPRHLRLSPLSASERKAREAEEAWARRQRCLYAMPGARIQPDFRRWNGRTINPSGKQAVASSSLSRVVRGFVKNLGAVLEAAKAEVSRGERSAHESRGAVVRAGPILLAALFLFVFAVVVLQVGRTVVGDWFDNNGDVYILMEKCEGWWLAA